MTDFTHLDALNVRLSHERAYLAAAKTTKERNLRSVWIAQIEREIAHARRQLSLTDTVEIDMTDDELLAALGA